MLETVLASLKYGTQLNLFNMKKYLYILLILTTILGCKQKHKLYVICCSQGCDTITEYSRSTIGLVSYHKDSDEIIIFNPQITEITK